MGNINNHGGDSDIAKLMTRKIEKQSSFWFFEKKPSAHCLPWISHLITFNYSLTLVRYDPRQKNFHQSERFRFHWRFISHLAECMHAVPGILPYDSYTQGKLFTINEEVIILLVLQCLHIPWWMLIKWGNVIPFLTKSAWKIGIDI